MSLVSYSLHTPVVVISDQCDNGAGSTLVTGCKTRSRNGRAMISWKITSVSSVSVFTAFVKYDVWYYLGDHFIYQYPNIVVGK